MVGARARRRPAREQRGGRDGCGHQRAGEPRSTTRRTHRAQPRRRHRDDVLDHLVRLLPPAQEARWTARASPTPRSTSRTSRTPRTTSCRSTAATRPCRPCCSPTAPRHQPVAGRGQGGAGLSPAGPQVRPVTPAGLASLVADRARDLLASGRGCVRVAVDAAVPADARTLADLVAADLAAQGQPVLQVHAERLPAPPLGAAGARPARRRRRLRALGRPPGAAPRGARPPRPGRRPALAAHPVGPR